MADDYLEIVDDSGQVIGRELRSLVHSNPALIHPVVHALVLNSEGQILLQHRSPTKDVQPDRWDTSVGGHLEPGEDPDTGVRREIAEELGITDVEPEFLYQYIWRSEIETELVRTYRVANDGPFSPDPKEITELKFFHPDEVRGRLGTVYFTPNFEHEFARYTAHLKNSPKV